jgi:hypothetical protein
MNADWKIVSRESRGHDQIRKPVRLAIDVADAVGLAVSGTAAINAGPRDETRYSFQLSLPLCETRSS